jgi:quercetin dioxygenase-like cupin family protein
MAAKAMTADQEAGALDAMVAAPDHHVLLLENSRVRVLDTCLAAGDRTSIHTHASPAALYS